MSAGALADIGGVAALGDATSLPFASTSFSAKQVASPALASVHTRWPCAPGTASALLAAPTAPAVSPMAAVNVATTIPGVLRIWWPPDGLPVRAPGRRPRPPKPGRCRRTRALHGQRRRIAGALAK